MRESLEGIIYDLLDMEQESATQDLGLEDEDIRKIRDDLEPSKRTLRLVTEFDDAVYKALDAWVTANKDKLEDMVTAETLFEEKGPYLIWATINGWGVGIWDGDWNEFFKDKSYAGFKELDNFLKKELQEYSVEGGGGKLSDSIEMDVDRTIQKYIDSSETGDVSES